MHKSTKLIDNSSEQYQLGSLLKELLADTAYSEVAIATGYWDLPGMVAIYQELQAFLNRENTSIRLVLGEEPSVRAYQVKNPARQDPGFPEKYLKKDLEDLQLRKEFQQVADLLEQHIDTDSNGKLQIKVYRKNFLHAKCYTIGSDQSVLDEEPVPQDFTEDLYSRDEKKRIEAFRKIFETSELLAAEDLFMDDLRDFDRNPDFDALYKEQIRNLPKGKWGRIQKSRQENEFSHLAHIIDDKDEAGYFVAYKNNHGELLAPTEGLLFIQAASSDNRRFKDIFENKPAAEAEITDYIKYYQFRESSVVNSYSQNEEAAIGLIRNAMFEYQYQFEDIDRVENCLLYSLNAYSNKKGKELVRKVNRLLRRNQPVTSEIIDEFVALARQHRHGELPERIPLNEIIQVFV